MADLITLDDYKVLEGVNSTQYDEKFETLITSVSKLVRTYCNSEFDTYASSPGYTEFFDIQWDTYTVQLTIEDTLCNNSFIFSFTDYFLISENRLYIPNSFTPNFDDKNELFIISGNSCLKNSSFVILSSYGEEIFKTDNPFEEFWDGTYNGKPAQGDTYIYRFESEKVNKNGYIVLYH